MCGGSVACPRATFAAILGRGATATPTRVREQRPISRGEFVAQFDDMIATLDDPSGYGVWHVPVIAGRVP
jgi:hypothetical protein